MKSFFSVCVLLLATSFFFITDAQGVFLQPFGQSFEEVKDFVDGQKTAGSNYDQDKITVWTHQYEIQYHFRGDRLYKQEVFRDYDDRREFREGIVSIRSHYEQQGLEVMDLSTVRDEHAFVVRKGNELHEIYQVPLGRNSFQLKQMRLDIDGCTSDEKNALRQDQHFASLLVDY